MSSLESNHFLISHEGDEEEVAGSSMWGHGTDGGLSDARQVGLGLDRLHVHTDTQVRGGAMIRQGSFRSFTHDKEWRDTNKTKV